MDNILGSQTNITNGKYPPAGTITDGFGSTFFDALKVFLELLLRDIYEPLPGGKGIDVTYIEVNCSATAINANLAKIASGFYS
jgi:hypothetical protein